MPRIEPVEPENAPERSKPVIEQGKQQAGKVINFYKQFAVAPTAFKGYMDLAGALQGGALDRQMQESIAVAVSDYHGCTYWLSAHSAVAEQEGLSQEERERAQRFESEDESRAAALRFVQAVVENDAHISDEVFGGVKEAGYSDEQIMEMIANVALTTFSNYTNDAIETEVDIPRVDPVHTS